MRGGTRSVKEETPNEQWSRLPLAERRRRLRELRARDSGRRRDAAGMILMERIKG